MIPFSKHLLALEVISTFSPIWEEMEKVDLALLLKMRMISETSSLLLEVHLLNLFSKKLKEEEKKSYQALAREEASISKA